MKIVWSPEASTDLNEIFDHILAEYPSAAAELADRIEAAVTGLVEFPAKGRPGTVIGTRELVISRSPYIVAYEADDRIGRIHILAVRHGARLWPEAFE